jgi:capsular exopolysaccharide synthesis family protein
VIPQHDASVPIGFAHAHAHASEPQAPQTMPRPLPAVQPAALTAGPDLMSFLDGLRRRWILATLLGGTLGVIAAVAVYFLLMPSATAYTKISVAFTEPGFMTRPGAVNDFKSVLATTASAITSRVVINAALKADPVKRLQLEKNGTDAAQMIEDGLRTEFKDNNEILTVYFTHPESQVALTVSNAIRDAYFDVIVRKQNEMRTNKISELETQYGALVESHKNKKENLARIGKVGEFNDPSQAMIEKSELLMRLRSERSELTKVQLELEKAKAMLQSFEDSMKVWQSAKKEVPTIEKPNVELLVAQALDADTKIRSLSDQLDAKQALVAEYDRRGMSSYESRKHREALADLRQQYSQRSAEITERVKAAIVVKEQEEMAKVATVPGGTRTQDPELTRAHLVRQVKNLQDFVNQIKEQIREDTNRAARIVPPGPEYDRLAAEIRRDEEMLNDLFRRLESEKLEARARPRVTPFPQSAELVKADFKKQLAATAVAPVAIFLAVAAGLAWLECTKRRVRRPAEISRGLGIRVVGAVPHQRDLSKQLIGPDGASDLEGTPVMESIDALRAALLHDHTRRSTRTVLVTSATSGEGKTTLAAALASSLARAGRKTLLLDGDLRRPSVHQLFEVPPQPGFSEVLLEEVPLHDALVESPLENLWVLPAGQWDREVLLALSRDGLGDIFERIGEEFDFVIIDSHPVLEAADALHIGRQVDAVLLSVLRDVSQMPRVYAAQQQIASLGIRVLGAVVNAASPEEALTAPSAIPATH